MFTEAEGDNFTRFLSGLIPAVVKVMNSLVDGLDEQENISSGIVVMNTKLCLCSNVLSLFQSLPQMKAEAMTNLFSNNFRQFVLFCKLAK